MWPWTISMLVLFTQASDLISAPLRWGQQTFFVEGHLVNILSFVLKSQSLSQLPQSAIISGNQPELVCERMIKAMFQKILCTKTGGRLQFAQ